MIMYDISRKGRIIPTVLDLKKDKSLRLREKDLLWERPIKPKKKVGGFAKLDITTLRLAKHMLLFNNY